MGFWGKTCQAPSCLSAVQWLYHQQIASAPVVCRRTPPTGRLRGVWVRAAGCPTRPCTANGVYPGGRDLTDLLRWKGTVRHHRAYAHRFVRICKRSSPKTRRLLMLTVRLSFLSSKSSHPPLPIMPSDFSPTLDPTGAVPSETTPLTPDQLSSRDESTELPLLEHLR